MKPELPPLEPSGLQTLPDVAELPFDFGWRLFMALLEPTNRVIVKEHA